MKLLSSTKIAIGFLVIATVSYAGFRYAATAGVIHEQFGVVTPGEVNLVGIDPGAGYRIVVANQMAQLIQGSGDFKSSDSGNGGPEDGAIKKRIPIKEMLGVLRGDTKSVGPFVMIMNDMKEDEHWPSVRVFWTSEKLTQALAGDAKAKSDLERDLNMKLDGTPLTVLRPSALANGIIIDFPVPLTINLGGKVQQVIGRVQTPYRPRMMKQVEDKYAGKLATPTMQAGYYAEAAQELIQNPGQREDVAKAIQSVLSSDNARRLASAPEAVLSSATVIVNDGHIANATYSSYDTGDGKRYNLTINLTDEGRRRLWKYSLNRVNSQVLLIASGIAIAAPRIEHELSQGELTITNMADQVLVRDATQMLNKGKPGADNSEHAG